MKSVADFKRKLTPGIKLHTVHHKEFSHRDGKGMPVWKDKDMGIAPVKRVMSTQFTILREKQGKEVESYMSYPKASEVEFNGNSIVIYETYTGEKTKLLTYTFVD